MTKLIFRIPSLDGGMVTDISPKLLDMSKGYMARMTNFDFSRHGKLQKRPGIAPEFLAVDNPILGAHEFIKASTADNYKIVAHGTVVQYWDGEAWVTLRDNVTEDAPFSFMTFADSLVMTNGIDASARWDGETLTTPDQFPKVKYLAEYRLRLVGAGDPAEPSMLYISHTGDPTLWDPADPSSNAAQVYVSPDDGEGISGLCNAGEGGLLIGKPSALYGLFGYSRANFMVDIIDPNLGVASHKSMVYIRPFVYFVNKLGIYRLMIGDTPERISAPIQDVFDSRVNLERLTEASAALVGHNYVITLPEGEAGWFTLAYHTENSAWSEWTAPYIGCAMKANDGSTNLGYCSFPGSNQFYRLGFDLIDDSTGAITNTIETLEMDAGQPEVTKEIQELHIICMRKSNPYTFTVEFKADDADWYTLSMPITISGAAGTQEIVRVPVGKTVRFFKLRLKSTAPNQEFCPLSLQLLYEPQEVW
jgi:hypothetical protein